MAIQRQALRIFELHGGELPSVSFTIWFQSFNLIAGWMGPTVPCRRG